VREVSRTRPVLIALLIVAIALITIDFRDAGTSSAHSVGGRIFGPLERASDDVTGWFGGGGGNSAEVKALQQQNAQLRAQLAQAQVSSQNQSQLGSVLHLTGKDGYQIVPASVIAAGGAYSDTVTISAGTSDGIAANETVLNGDGLVGTVIAATSTTATVQLSNDVGATVGIRMAGSGQIGALAGTADTFNGTAPLKLTLFNATATLKLGQEVMTFGSVGGRPYVPGIPIGTVTKVTTEPGSLTPTALVTPFAHFTGLGVLGVVISK
jgi:rod shape-determining protein MreC